MNDEQCNIINKQGGRLLARLASYEGAVPLPACSADANQTTPKVNVGFSRHVTPKSYSSTVIDMGCGNISRNPRGDAVHDVVSPASYSGLPFF